MSLNKVCLIGNLGRDPEVTNLQSGSKKVSFTVATGKTWTDKASGESKSKTQWHRIVIWNERIGDFAERYLRKGNQIYIEGELESRKYTPQQGGAEVEVFEVVLNRFEGRLESLTRKDSDSEGPAGDDNDRPAARPANRTSQGATTRGSLPKGNADSDDIPF